MNNILSGDAWVLTVDSAYMMGADGNRQLRLALKGQTSIIAGVLSSIYVGQSLTDVSTVLALAFNSIDDAGLSIDWSCPTGYKWKVSGTEVKQIEAGECSILTLLFSAESDSYDPGQDYTRVLQDTIAVQWQTYSVSPYRYCNELDHVDAVVKQDGTTLSSNSNNKSIRAHIEQALTQNSIDKGQNWTRYQAGNNITYELTKAEKLIAEKVAAGTNPVFHYPIVQHTRIVETNLSSLPSGYEPDVDTGIDIIALIPYSIGARIEAALMPWEQLSGSYIYCGQSANCLTRVVKSSLSTDVTINTWTLVDTFEGALNPDPNFYGTNFDPSSPTGRWEFGVGPQPGNN